jgi:hypothetical protein
VLNNTSDVCSGSFFASLSRRRPGPEFIQQRTFSGKTSGLHPIAEVSRSQPDRRKCARNRHRYIVEG